MRHLFLNNVMACILSYVLCRGADDHATKPLNPRKLLARIRARLRHSQPSRPARQIQAGQLEMDLDRHIDTVAGEEIDLTPTQFDLLRTLMQHPGYVFSRDELLEEAVGYTFEGLGLLSKAINSVSLSLLGSYASWMMQACYGIHQQQPAPWSR